MSETPARSLRLPVSKLTAFAIFLLAGIYASLRMINLPLWGWWPLVMLLSLWSAIVMIFFPKDPTEKKWLGSATVAGLGLGLGFPPSPLTFIVCFAWIPLLAVENGIYEQRDKVNPKKVFLYSFHAFVLWNIIATFWVTNTALIAGIVANFVNAALMAVVMVIIHLLRHRLPKPYFFWVLASAWISFEYLHHYWDLSWPWLTLGNTMAEYPWAIQWYEGTGIFGGSLWILTLNYVGYNIIMRWLHAKPLKIWRYATLWLVPLVISLWIWFSIKPSSQPPVNITVVQPNFEPHYEKFDIPQREQTARFLQLSLDHIDSTTDYLVYPETSFDGIRLNTFRENPVIQVVQSMIDSFPRLQLVTGISSFRILEPEQLEMAAYRIHLNNRGDTTYWDIQNAAVQMSAQDPAYQLYFKSKLVPGPEMFPFRKVLFFMKPVVDKLGGSYEGHTKQKDRNVFTGGELNVAPIICYESVYGAFTGDYVKKGANAFFIVTNDGWWDKTPGHIQHLKLGAMRAIEHRRPIARSANTGISCFIDIKGKIHQPTAYGVATAIRGSLIPETRKTLYTRLGDVIAKLGVILFFGLLLVVVWRAWIKKRDKIEAFRPV